MISQKISFAKSASNNKKIMLSLCVPRTIGIGSLLITSITRCRLYGPCSNDNVTFEIVVSIVHNKFRQQLAEPSTALPPKHQSSCEESGMYSLEASQSLP